MKYNPGKRAPQPHHPLASVLLVNCNHCLWWITFHQVNTCWQQPLISHSAAHFYIIFCFLFSHFFSLSSVEAKAEQKRVDNSFFFLLPNLHSSNFPVCNKMWILWSTLEEKTQSGSTAKSNQTACVSSAYSHCISLESNPSSLDGS